MTKPVGVAVGGTSRRRIWWLTIRPATLTISLAPVLAGTALARRDTGRILWVPFALAACAALLIQIGTNLYNDVGDYERGADRAERLGPPRAVSSGWLEPGEVRRAVALVFGIALVAGAWLVWHGGWPILVLGIASIAAGLAYTGGPRPIAYSGTGEAFVFVFFGLVVNNYRDLDNDRSVGKHTFAVRVGRTRSRVEFVALLVAPYFLLIALSRVVDAGWWLLLPLCSAPMAAWIAVRFSTECPGPGFNRILADTAQLQLVFSCLLAVALLL